MTYFYRKVSDIILWDMLEWMGKTDIETIERNKIPMKEFTCINYNCNCKYKANLGEQRKCFSRWGKGEKHTEACSIKYFDEIESELNLAKFEVEKSY